jgi:hypothetical protein
MPAAIAVILSVLTLARDWSQLRLHDLAMLFIALALGADVQRRLSGTRG